LAKALRVITITPS